MNRKSFGKTSKGVEAFKHEIANAQGMKAELTDFGATQCILLPLLTNYLQSIVGRICYSFVKYNYEYRIG